MELGLMGWSLIGLAVLALVVFLLSFVLEGLSRTAAVVIRAAVPVVLLLLAAYLIYRFSA